MTEDLHRLTVAEALEAISAPAPTSGAGIAAALALATALACARKAVGISLKRDDAPALAAAENALALQQHRAVAHARRDQMLFQAWLASPEPVRAQQLVDSAQLFQQLLDEAAQTLRGLAGQVAGSVAGDIEAAQVLHEAAARIGARLLHEARAARSHAVR